MTLIKAGLIIEIPAGESKNIDVSGAVGEIVEGTGATATATRITDLDQEEGIAAIAVTSPQELPSWPFIRVSAADGTVFVGLNYLP